jgi:hypothetical protein
LLDSAHVEKGLEQLNQMLVTLWTAGYVKLDPKPKPKSSTPQEKNVPTTPNPTKPTLLPKPSGGLFEAAGLGAMLAGQSSTPAEAESDDASDDAGSRGYDLKNYQPEFAYPEERLELLVRMRSINPLYGEFLAGHLAIADDTERLLVLESTLELPGTVARHVRVPKIEFLPPGPLATTRLDGRLLELGLASQEELIGRSPDDDEPRRPRGSGVFEEEPVWIITIGEKLQRLFQYDFPKVHDFTVTPVHVAGEVLEFGGHFNKYITAKGLQKHEGIIFRHLLRLILLLDEMASIPPVESTPEDWEDRFDALIDRLTECCRQVDPESTDEMLESGRGGDELTKQLEGVRQKSHG